MYSKYEFATTQINFFDLALFQWKPITLSLECPNFGFIQLFMRFYTVLNCIFTDNEKITQKVRQLNCSGFRARFVFRWEAAVYWCVPWFSITWFITYDESGARDISFVSLYLWIWRDNCHRYWCIIDCPFFYHWFVVNKLRWPLTFWIQSNSLTFQIDHFEIIPIKQIGCGWLNHSFTVNCAYYDL